MATNWSSSSGFGGGLGGGRLGNPYARGNSNQQSTPPSPGSGVGSWAGTSLSNPDRNYRGSLNDFSSNLQPIDAGRMGPSPMYKNVGQYTPPTQHGTISGPARQGDPLANFPTPGDPYGVGAGVGAATGFDIAGKSYMDLIASQYQPQLAAAAAYPDYLTGMAGLQSQQRDLQRQGLISDAGFDQSSIALKLRGVGLDRDSNALKMAGYGLDRQDNSAERGLVARLRELAGLDNTNRANRISFEGQDQARQIRSGYTTGGTLFSPGHTYDQGANYLRTLNDLNAQEYGYQKELAGFDRRDQSLDTADARIGLSEQELGIANQRLDLMASQLGIDSQRLQSALDRGLAQLGLEGKISAAELAFAITNAKGDQAKIVAQIVSDALAMGMPPGDWLNWGTGGSTTY